MKILIPLDENKKDVCIVFGRSPYFMLYDIENNKTTILENPAANVQGGAGLKSAQFVVDSGADILITVRCGENASEVLKLANIKIYKSQSKLASDDIELFKQGKLDILEKFHAGYHGNN